MKHKFALLILAAAALCPRLDAQPAPLAVERRGDVLHVAARLGFLAGRPLERLHNGASVTYVFSLSLATGGGRLSHLEERFTVSFDLWEEKFAVVQARTPARSVSHLSAAAAEAWCLDNLALPLPSLPADKTFVIKLECRVEEPESEAGGENRAGLALAGLIDVFSRKGREPELRWEAVSGPLRLADLKHRKNDRTRSR